MAKATTGKKKVFRKKEKKNVPSASRTWPASFNNTMISITDLEGNLIAHRPPERADFAARARNPFAAQQAAYEAAKKAHERACNSVKFA